MALLPSRGETLIIRSQTTEISATLNDEVVLGRSMEADFQIAADDSSVSRRAAMLRFEGDSWVLRNTGRRSIYLVEPTGEVELPPTEHGFERRIVHPDCWIRFPGQPQDHVVVLIVDEFELPAREVLEHTDSLAPTTEERPVVLTENERRSIVAVYAAFLKLPPEYARAPVSFRAAAVQLNAAEGKVKADHRRVVDKVLAAGGPDSVSSNRERLITWLLTRRVITSADLALLDEASD